MTLSIPVPTRQTAMSVLIALSATHLLNDTIQSLIPAIYPIIKDSLSARLHPDRPDHADVPGLGLAAPAGRRLRDRPASDAHSMVAGMACSLVGLIGTRLCGKLRAAAARRSLCRHRLLDLPSGGDAHGAQRVRRAARVRASHLSDRGQTGSAIGPLLAAFVIVPRGQTSLAWFSVAAFVAILLMIWIARSMSALLRARQERPTPRRGPRPHLRALPFHPSSWRSPS